MGQYALVLAAGKGTRFRSSTPKVLQPLAGRPLICHLLDSLSKLALDRIFVVAGSGARELRQALSDSDVTFVEQLEQKGTGHAVLVASEVLRGLEGSLLVLYGDSVLVPPQQLAELLDSRERSGAEATLLTAVFEDPTGYGRIVRNADGRLSKIVEEKDASPEQQLLREVNTGFYCFHVPTLLEVLPQLGNANHQGEYYLTDVPALLLKAGKKVETVQASDGKSLAGVNDPVQLAAAERQLRAVTNRSLLEAGVRIIDPEHTYVDSRVEIATDTVLYPNVVIEGRCQIGPGCTIRANVHIVDSTIDAEVTLDHGSVIRNSHIGNRTNVGPYAHLRDGCQIGANVRIGNFVEIKKSVLGDGSKAAHLTYLGDAVLGKNVNIGAGTITCNYDGTSKNVTLIGDRVFVGSNTQLIAPVRIGNDAYIAAGSTITDDVPAGSLAVARSRQVNKTNWKKQLPPGD